MKKIIMAAVASTVMFSGSAFAQIGGPISPSTPPTYGQDAEGWYAIQATGQRFCRFGTNNSGQNGANSVVTTDGFGGAAEADGTFTFDIQDDNNNTLQAASGSYRINNVVCNTPFTVTARSDNGGLQSTNTTNDSAFVELVKYTVTFQFENLTGSQTSQTTAATLFSSPEARAGQATLTVATQANTTQLILQGAYSDKLTLTMTPTV